MQEFFENILKQPSDKIAAFAALLSLISLVVTIISTTSTRKYARKQVELAQKQFTAVHTPDIEIKVFCQRTKPDSHDFTLGLFMEATNHSTSVTVNQISVMLISESLGDFQGFGTFFPTFTDLKPGQKQKLESLQEFEKLIASSFPQNTVDHFDLGTRTHPFLNNENYEKYPATLTTEFLPRITGASLVKRTEEMYLIVMRKNI